MNNSKKNYSKKNSKSSNRNYKSSKFKDVGTKNNKESDMYDSFPTKNDYRFYAASEQIAKDVASIPFNYIGGTALKTKLKILNSDNSVEEITCRDAIPSVMTVLYSPGYSVGRGPANALNMATVQLYTKIRKNNSGAKNYEAADVMMYIQAMRDIYSNFFEIKKVLGFTALYSTFNHNMPNTFFRAMGYRDDAVQDIRANQAQYRARLNELARKINSFAVPKYFSAFERSAFINSFLFSDSTSMRAQYYVFRRIGYYTWSGTTDERGTELIFHPTIEHQVSNWMLSSAMDKLDEQLNALFLDTDALTMSGDISKAFADGELYTIAETPDSYATGILNDDDVKSQIENACAFTGSKLDDIFAFSNIESLNLTQENQLLVWEPDLESPATRGASMENFAFNSHKDQPDYKDVLEWTRLMSTANIKVGSQGTINYQVDSCGLELVWGYSITWYKETTNGTSEIQTKYISQYPGAVSSSGDTDILMTHFDWHPMLYYKDTAADLGLPFGESKVMTTISKDVVKKINEAAMYGAFYSEKNI